MATFKFLCAILLSFQLRDHVIGADNDVACPFDADECTCTFPQSDTAFDSATCISKSSTFPSFNGSRTYSIYNELTIQFGASRIESGALQAFSSIESLTLKEDVSPTPIRQQWQPHAFTGPEINTFRVVNTAGVIPLPAPLREIAENLKELRIVSCREAVDLGANSFSDFKQLRVLEISYTPIVVFSDTTFNGLGETLREIYLQSNKLSYFPTSALKNLVLLYRIDLSDNNIRSFSEDAFSSLSELAFLTLDGNDVQAAIDSGALSNLPQATTSLSLQRSNPALKSIPTKVIRDVPQLVTLSLANNYIDTVRTGDFLNTSQIFSLFLAGNPITTIQPGSLQDLPGLTHLDLSQTALESLDFSLFEGLNNLFAVILDETRTLKSLTISNLDMVPPGIHHISVVASGVETIDPAFEEVVSRKYFSVFDLSNTSLDCTQDIRWMAKYALCVPYAIGISNAVCRNTGESLRSYLYTVVPAPCEGDTTSTSETTSTTSAYVTTTHVATTSQTATTPSGQCETIITVNCNCNCNKQKP